MYTYKTLENCDLAVLYQVFIEAFSDYQVDISLSFADFQKMLKRRGCDLYCSVGAFSESDGEMVGFVFNGVRNWNGMRTAYDMGTGIIPAHRRRGITAGMLGEVKSVLASNHVEQYLLEVLQNNHTAFEIYKKQGFCITKEYSFYEMEKDKFISGNILYRAELVSEILPEQWEHLRSFWDFVPSWQNSVDSVLAVWDAFAYALVYADGQIVGYGIIDKSSGDIPQLAVHKGYRCQGIASSLMTALSENTDSNLLRIINIDNACETMYPFLTQCGYIKKGDQYEMLLALG